MYCFIIFLLIVFVKPIVSHMYEVQSKSSQFKEEIQNFVHQWEKHFSTHLYIRTFKGFFIKPPKLKGSKYGYYGTGHFDVNNVTLTLTTFIPCTLVGKHFSTHLYIHLGAFSLNHQNLRAQSMDTYNVRSTLTNNNVTLTLTTVILESVAKLRFQTRKNPPGLNPGCMTHAVVSRMSIVVNVPYDR